MLLSVSIALVAYLGVVAAAYLGQRGLMYHPAGPPPAPAQLGLAEFRAVTVPTADGLALTAWYAPAPQGAPTVALFHGNAGNLVDRAAKLQALHRAGLGVLGLQYRGFGGNPGRISEAGLYRDGAAALAYLAERGVPADEVVLYGESLGTGIATEMATRHDVRAVVLEAPFLSMARLAQGYYPVLPAYWLVKDRYANTAKAPQIQAPLLILHGTADRVVPPWHSQRLAARWGGPVARRTLEGYGHVALPGDLLARHVADFLAARERGPAHLSPAGEAS